jgi:hypothetical protein
MFAEICIYVITSSHIPNLLDFMLC